MVKARGDAQAYLRRLDLRLRKAVDAAGALVEDTAQKYSPVNTGTMMASVHHTDVVGDERGYRTTVGPGLEAPYAQYTEKDEFLVTRSGRRKKLGRISVLKGTAQMPWLRPALHDNEAAIKSVIKAAVRP
jgi:hypothetical protein